MKHALERGLDRRTWYREFYEGLCRRYPGDARRMACLIACTSMRASVSSSITLAEKAARLLDAGQSLHPHLIRGHVAAIEHWLQTGTLRGPKIAAFAAAILGDPNAVPVDRWMYRVAEIPPTRKSRLLIVDGVTALARDYGISPAEAQASIWCGAKRLAGDSAGLHPTGFFTTTGELWG